MSKDFRQLDFLYVASSSGTGVHLDETPKDWVGIAVGNPPWKSDTKYWYIGFEDRHRSYTPLKAQSYENAYEEAADLKVERLNDNIGYIPFDKNITLLTGIESIRFKYEKMDGSKKPHKITDRNTDPAEDPVIYSFTSAQKALQFKSDMEAEHGQYVTRNTRLGRENHFSIPFEQVKTTLENEKSIIVAGDNQDKFKLKLDPSGEYILVSYIPPGSHLLKNKPIENPMHNDVVFNALVQNTGFIYLDGMGDPKLLKEFINKYELYPKNNAHQSLPSDNPMHNDVRNIDPDRFSGRMVVEKAIDLSDSEINRVFANTVAPKLCIESVTHLRDHDGLTIDKVYGSWESMATVFYDAAYETYAYHNKPTDLRELKFHDIPSPHLVEAYHALKDRKEGVASEDEWKQFVELYIQRDVTPDRFWALMEEATTIELEIAKGRDTPQLDSRLVEINKTLDNTGLKFDMDTYRVTLDESEEYVPQHYLLASINNTDNAAFIDVGRENEIARILLDAADRIQNSSFETNGTANLKLLDLNGNSVGDIKIVKDEPYISKSPSALSIHEDVAPGTVKLIAALEPDGDLLESAANRLRGAADNFIHSSKNEFSMHDMDGNEFIKFIYKEPESLLSADAVDMKVALKQGRVYLVEESASIYSSEGFRFVVADGDYELGYGEEPGETAVVNARGEIAPDDGDTTIRENGLSEISKEMADGIRAVADGTLSLEKFNEKHFPSNANELGI